MAFHAVRCETLHLVRTRTGDKAMRTIARLPKLRELHLDYTDISDEGLALLHGSAIEELRLDAAAVSDKAIESLASLSSLKRLDLYHTFVTEAGKQRLQAALPDCDIVFDADSSRPNRRRA